VQEIEDVFGLAKPVKAKEIGLVQKRRILGNKDNRRPAFIFMRLTV
jgi:hypothetical protein